MNMQMRRASARNAPRFGLLPCANRGDPVPVAAESFRTYLQLSVYYARPYIGAKTKEVSKQSMPDYSCCNCVNWPEFDYLYYKSTEIFGLAGFSKWANII